MLLSAAKSLPLALVLALSSRAFFCLINWCYTEQNQLTTGSTMPAKKPMRGQRNKTNAKKTAMGTKPKPPKKRKVRRA